MRRYGKFRVSQYMDVYANANEILHNIKSKISFKTINVMQDPNSFSCYHFGTSPLFREVGEGDTIPEYDILCTRNSPNEALTVEVVEKNV